MAVSFWDRLKSWFVVDVQKASPENPSTNLAKPDEWLQSIYAPKSKAGVNVGLESTIGITAIWRALAILSETIGSLPKEVIEKLPNGDIETRFEHPVYKLIDVEPSNLYTSFDFFGALIINTCLFGNGLALIERRRVSNRPIRLTLLDPSKFRVVLEDGKLFYVNDTDRIQYNQDDVIHLKSLSVDGVVGLGIIDAHRENLGLAIANRDYLSTYFAKGAHLSGVLEHPATLKDAAYNRVRTSWNTRYSGVDNTGGTAILEEGMTFKPMSNHPKDAMSLEAQRFSVEDVSRMTGVPVHMLQNLDRATFNNIEVLSLEFAKYTIRPWAKRLEQECNRKLYQEQEKGRIKTRLNMDALLRGDTKSRAELYQSGILNGWLSRNEVRKMEKLNSVEGLDEYLVPQNMATVDENGQIIPNNQPDNVVQPQTQEQ